MSVELTDADGRAVAAFMAGVLRERAVRGLPIGHELIALHRRVERALEPKVLSSSRQGGGLIRAELGASRIGSRQAAAILGWGVRRVQRHSAELGAQLVGDRLVYDERTITRYANRLSHNRTEDNAA